MSDIKKDSKRKSVRFPADVNLLAIVSVQIGKEKKEYVGLLLNESVRGCRAAFRDVTPLKVGQLVKIAVGPLNAMQAEIAWVKKSGELMVEAGFKLLE